MCTVGELDEKLDASLNLMNMRVCLHLSDQIKCEKYVSTITGTSPSDHTLKMHILRIWSRQRRALTSLYGMIHAIGTMKDQTRMRGIQIELKEVVKSFCETNQHVQAEVLATDVVMESAATVSLQMQQLSEIVSGSFLVEDGNTISTDEDLLQEFQSQNISDTDLSDPACQPNYVSPLAHVRPSVRQNM